MPLATLYHLSQAHQWLDCVASPKGDRLVVLREWLPNEGIFAVHYYSNLDYYIGYFSNWENCLIEFQRRANLIALSI